MKNNTVIATPPGATIKEQLEDRCIGKEAFAAMMEMSEQKMSSLLDGRIPLTEEIAARLETVLGVPAQFWNNLETIYREKLKIIN